MMQVALLPLLLVLFQPAPPSSAAQASAPNAAAATAEEPAVVSQALVPPVRDRDQLLALWRVRARSVEEGDTERADKLLAEIVSQRRDGGVVRLDPFAHAVLREARAAWSSKNNLRAEELLAQARQLAPGLPEIEEAEASRVLAEQPWAVHRWFLSKAKAARLRLADFQRRSLLLADSLLGAFFVVGLVALTFLGSQVGRHGLALAHGLGRAVPALNPWIVLGALGVAVSVPLVFGFGPLLIAFPLFVLLWVHQNTAERALSVVCVLLLGAIPWTLRAVDRFSEAGTGVSQALNALTLDPSDVRAAETVKAALAFDAEDWQAAATLGLAEKRLGRLDEAIRMHELAHRHVPAGTPDAGLVKNNLANARLASGRAVRAEALFKESIDLLPGAAEPLFNLSRLYTRTGRLSMAREQFERASNLQTERVAMWNDDLDLNLNRYVVDLPLGADRLLERELGALFAPTPLSGRTWLLLAGPLPEAISPALAVSVLVAFGVLSATRRHQKVVLPCPRCARPAEKLARSTEVAPLCEQCHSLFVRNVPVDRRVRFEKEEQIARYRTLRVWSLRTVGALLPGLGSMLQGQPMRAILPLAVVGVLVWRLVFPGGLLSDPSPASARSDLELPILIGVLGVLWLVNGLAVQRQSRSLT